MYNDLATRLCEAIRKFSKSEDALLNFESYLTYHFPAWMEKYASDPEHLVSEFENFAAMTD